MAPGDLWTCVTLLTQRDSRLSAKELKNGAGAVPTLNFNLLFASSLKLQKKKKKRNQQVKCIQLCAFKIKYMPVFYP